MYQFNSQGGGGGGSSANHAFDLPGWVGTLGLDGYTIVEGGTKVGTTTDQDGNRIGVGSILREEDASTLQRVGATSKEARDGTGHIRKDDESIECSLVKKARFIVVSCHTTSV